MEPSELSEAEQEFIALCNELGDSLREFYEALRGIEDANARLQFAETHNPARAFTPRLQEFEESYRATHTGLMAARRLLMLGVGAAPLGAVGISADCASARARRAALEVLDHYEVTDELASLLELLPYGEPELEVERFLRRLLANPHISERHRTLAQFALASWAVAMRNHRRYLERRQRELAEGAAPSEPLEPTIVAERLRNAIASEKILALETEAREILMELCDSASNVRWPSMLAVTKRLEIVRVDPDAVDVRPAVSELAREMLARLE